jgi:hypothetical protein
LILVQAEGGGDVAGGEVSAVATCGCPGGAADRETTDSRQVGADGLDLGCGAEHDDVLGVVAVDRARLRFGALSITP